MANTATISDFPSSVIASNEGGVRTQGVSIRTADHYGLCAQLLTPTADAPAHTNGRGGQDVAVVLHPATGVDYHFYRKLGKFLTSEYGWPTVIYDYRGTALSAFTTDKSNREIQMSDWMLLDAPAVVNWMKEKFPNHKIATIGHSVGAHGQYAVQSREASVDAQVAIAAHAGVTQTVRGPLERTKVWGFFNVVVPLFSRLLGYVPTEAIGLGKQIPLGVAEQWGRWAGKPGYFFQDGKYDFAVRYQEATGPILSVVFSDDEWANREASNILTDQLVSADVQKWDIQVGKGGEQGPVGHMGFYRSSNKNLWTRVANWIADAVK